MFISNTPSSKKQWTVHLYFHLISLLEETRVNSLSGVVFKYTCLLELSEEFGKYADTFQLALWGEAGAVAVSQASISTSIHCLLPHPIRPRHKWIRISEDQAKEICLHRTFVRQSWAPWVCNLSLSLNIFATLGDIMPLFSQL